MGRNHRSLWVVPFFTMLLAFGCSDEATEVVFCEGQCTCDQALRSCACLGGTTCEMEGENDVTFTCDGNASCDFTCGAGCLTECPGTSVCTATMGTDSTARCNGTGRCDVTCDGDCEVACSGNEECTVRCPDDAECVITECTDVVSCEGQNAQACRTECPPPPE